MHPTGWLFLSLSWSGILGLTIFCFARLLRKR
jgi:hypothetical protein